LPLLHRTAIIEKHTCYDFLAKYPKVEAWQVAMLETSLPVQSVSDDFEEYFTDFFLSGKTYLGNGDNNEVNLSTQCGGSNCCG